MPLDNEQAGLSLVPGPSVLVCDVLIFVDGVNRKANNTKVGLPRNVIRRPQDVC